jgi:hypothetical protein
MGEKLVGNLLGIGMEEKGKGLYTVRTRALAKYPLFFVCIIHLMVHARPLIASQVHGER